LLNGIDLHAEDGRPTLDLLNELADLYVQAGAGEREKAVQRLITGLCSRRAAITTTEYGDLRALAEVLGVPSVSLDALPVHRSGRPRQDSATVPP
jgi:hypothetical protein